MSLKRMMMNDNDNFITFIEFIKVITKNNSTILPIANDIETFIIDKFTLHNNYTYTITTDITQKNKDVVYAKYNITDIANDLVYDYVKLVNKIVINDLEDDYIIERSEHFNPKRITFAAEMIIIAVLSTIILCCFIIIVLNNIRKREIVSS